MTGRDSILAAVELIRPRTLAEAVWFGKSFLRRLGGEILEREPPAGHGERESTRRPFPTQENSPRTASMTGRDSILAAVEFIRPRTLAEAVWFGKSFLRRLGGEIPEREPPAPGHGERESTRRPFPTQENSPRTVTMTGRDSILAAVELIRPRTLAEAVWFGKSFLRRLGGEIPEREPPAPGHGDRESTRRPSTTQENSPRTASMTGRNSILAAVEFIRPRTLAEAVWFGKSFLRRLGGEIPEREPPAPGHGNRESTRRPSTTQENSPRTASMTGRNSILAAVEFIRPRTLAEAVRFGKSFLHRLGGEIPERELPAPGHGDRESTRRPSPTKKNSPRTAKPVILLRQQFPLWAAQTTFDKNRLCPIWWCRSGFPEAPNYGRCAPFVWGLRESKILSNQSLPWTFGRLESSPNHGRK